MDRAVQPVRRGRPSPGPEHVPDPGTRPARVPPEPPQVLPQAQRLGSAGRAADEPGPEWAAVMGASGRARAGTGAGPASRRRDPPPGRGPDVTISLVGLAHLMLR